MDEERDPVERAAGGAHDLYDVATWDPRTRLDRLSVRVHAGIVRTARAVVVLAALSILVAQFVLTGLATVANPAVGAFALLSILPAAGIAAYVWRADVTMGEPLGVLVVTFLLGVLFASFAAILNTFLQPLFAGVPLIGMALFFYLVVAPVEETVKWLAVRLYAFRDEAFDAVIDGAVYGAVAGLGFATIENTLYIGQQYLTALRMVGTADPLEAAFGTAVVRVFAGPGHVIYSGFAGYYLGLAKFNREDAGPIVVKGLLVAALIHATYNTLVGIVPSFVAAAAGVSGGVAFIGFVLVYDGIVGYALYRKIARYRRAYEETGAGQADEDEPTDTEPLDVAEGGTDQDSSGGSG